MNCRTVILLAMLAGCSAPGLPENASATDVRFYPTINDAIVEHQCIQCHARMFSADDSPERHHNFDALADLPSAALMRYASESFYCGPQCFTADEARALEAWADGRPRR